MFSDDELKMVRDAMGTEAYEQRKFIDSVPDKETKRLSTIQLKRIEKLQEKINSEINKTPFERACENFNSRCREQRTNFFLVTTPISKTTGKFLKNQEFFVYAKTLKHIGKRLKQMGIRNE